MRGENFGCQKEIKLKTQSSAFGCKMKQYIPFITKTRFWQVKFYDSWGHWGQRGQHF